VAKAQRKAEARLEKRRSAFDNIKGEGTGSRAGAKYVRTQGGKAVMYHRPGSVK
jgi:hypothetical protein